MRAGKELVHRRPRLEPADILRPIGVDIRAPPPPTLAKSAACAPGGSAPLTPRPPRRAGYRAATRARVRLTSPPLRPAPHSKRLPEASLRRYPYVAPSAVIQRRRSD